MVLIKYNLSDSLAVLQKKSEMYNGNGQVENLETLEISETSEMFFRDIQI